MKIRILTIIMAAVSFCTHAHAQETDIERDRVFDLLDSYQTVSSLLFEPEFSGPMAKQLRLQAAAIPAEEFRNASPELIAQFERLEETIAEIPMTVSTTQDDARKLTTGVAATTSTASASQGFPQPRDLNLSWTVPIDNSGQPDDDAPGTIGANGRCDSTGPLNGRQRYDLQTSAIALEAVADIASKICGQEALVGDASIACIVTDVAFVIAFGINENVQNCEALIDTVTLVGSHARLDHIGQDLGDFASGIETQIVTSTSEVEQELTSSELEISNAIAVTADDLDTSVTAAADDVQSTLAASEAALTERLANAESNLIDTTASNTRAIASRINLRSDRIDAAVSENLSALDAFRRNNFRYHIEKNLGEKSGAIGLFVLPISRGGSIETVDGIVEDTIDSTATGSNSARQARRSYDRARKLYTQGQFKDAFQWYRAAYQAASRNGDGSEP